MLIGLLGSPASGKTTLAAALFSELKIKAMLLNFSQNMLESILWKKDIEIKPLNLHR